MSGRAPSLAIESIAVTATGKNMQQMFDLPSNLWRTATAINMVDSSKMEETTMLLLLKSQGGDRGGW
jgi:hypothetical protein